MTKSGRMVSILCIALLRLIILPSGKAAADETPHPPIAIHFSLAKDSFVTLVIEKPDGVRVRNLISETPFPAGENVAWWDGLDDLARDTDAAAHAEYHVPGALVSPGTYRVRGIARPALHVIYEFNPNTNGNPPWRTADRGSEWLANHTAPSAALFVPAGAVPQRDGKSTSAGGQILIGSWVAEGGSGLAWLDMDGNKIWGQSWLGGVWTGATQLARDNDQHPDPAVYAYAAASWRGDKYNNNVTELRLRELVNHPPSTKGHNDDRMGSGEDVAVLTPYFKIPPPVHQLEVALDRNAQRPDLAGLAARNGLVIAALEPQDLLLFVDAPNHRMLGTVSVADPRGVAFDSAGKLLVLSGQKLLRYSIKDDNPTDIGKAEVLITAGLEDPQNICLDRSNQIFIADWGNSHQVKVFSADGKLSRAIGDAGASVVGPYDQRRMSHPAGITVDDHDRLWVSEKEKAPKRVSLWSTNGDFIKAFYGPPKYGGGGTIDPLDKTRFFYSDEGGGTEFKLDWKTGSFEPTAVFARPELDQSGLTGKYVGASPDYPLHHNGRTYLTDAYDGATGGLASASIWLLDSGIAKRVASAGNTLDAAKMLLPAFNTPTMRALMPAKTNPDKDPLLFVWSDLNGNGRVDADEVQFLKPAAETVKGSTRVSDVSVQDDLSFAISCVGDVSLKLIPANESEKGVPAYDLKSAKVIAHRVQPPVSSGGGQTLLAGEWTITTTPPLPFARQSLGGLHNGIPTWSYPSLWPGLHASHIAAMPDMPGELIGTTHVLGNPIDAPDGSDAGKLWAINGNKGNVYLFTADGLFIATLFRDSRIAGWDAPQAVRGMDVSQLSINEECFGPTMTRTPDGNIYLQAGASGPILRIDGLDQIKRLPDSQITVSQNDLATAMRWSVDAETQRQSTSTEAKVLDVPLLDTPPVLDEKLSAWPPLKLVVNGKPTTQPSPRWAIVDERAIQVGNFGRRKSVTAASMAVANDRLFLVLRTDDPALLNNSGESLQNLFKTGGCIDLMLSTDPNRPKGAAAMSGDERLLVTRVQGKTTAVLYRPIFTTTSATQPHEPPRESVHEPVQFSSPMRTIRFDRVDDVSSNVDLSIITFAPDKTRPGETFYQVAIPLSTLALSPAIGKTVRGDIGVLRGNGFQTLQRAYWSNKASGLVSDIPSEAELTPALWGTFRFEQ